MIIGSVLMASNPGVTDPMKYNYTVPMCVFASCGVAALILGFALKALDAKKGYGLEKPNSVAADSDAEKELIGAAEAMEE